MTEIVTLKPFAVSFGPIPPGASAMSFPDPYWDVPTSTGGGSVVDDSDDSYYTLHAWEQFVTERERHTEPVSGDFALPPGYANPVAFVPSVRIRTPPATLNGPAFPDTIFFELRPTSDPSVRLAQASLIGPRSGLPLQGIATVSQAEPAWATTWYGNDVDLSNPSDAGNWVEIAAATFDPADTVAALTGTGLRVTLHVESTQYDMGRIPWIDLFEFRLIVACEASAKHSQPWLRAVQRNDGLGASGTPRHVQTSTRANSLRGGPNAIY